MPDDLLSIGLHYGIPFPQYAVQYAMNSGALRYASLSMAHVHAAFDGRIPSSDSQARKFGRMVHMRLLEPHRWDDAAIADPCCAILKSGDRKGEACGLNSQYTLGRNWFCGKHAPPDAVQPRDFASRDEAWRIERMAEAVQFDFTGGETEVVAIADVDGVRCKGRFDLMTDAAIYDFKKCMVGDADPETCEKSILSYGWHIQAALYLTLAKQLTGVDRRFTWIFIEDGEPYSVVEMEADDETINIGRSEVTLALRRWRECVESGKYPGPVSRPGGLPLWYRERWADDNFKVTA